MIRHRIRHNRSISLGAAIALLTSIAIPAIAADGVLEINQARALAGGISASDTPGFPVTLDATGSYALTSDLIVASISANAIVVTSPDVSLDLRGFTIQGPCPPTGCTGGNGGINASVAGVQLREGRIRGFPGIGVVLGDRSRISRLHVEQNGDDGIRVGAYADVVDSTATRNARIGISVSTGSRVRHCVADSNGRGGIVAGNHAIVSDSTTRNNSSDDALSFGSGILSATGVLVRGNTMSSNLRYGIIAEGPGNLVLDNVATANGSSGIVLGGPGSVQGNSASQNVVTGINLFGIGGNRTAYRDNVVNANGTSAGVSGGTNLGGNSCNGAATCP